MELTTQTPTTLAWSPVCTASTLARGQVLALHVRGQALALFLTCDGEFYALADRDPDAGHGALSNGVLGSRRDVPIVVAAGSGRRFALADGACVDGGASVTAFPVRVTDGAVEVAVPAA